ncbi:hypothetical protein QQF64_004572 [Cirrhinus molitorella]|uniref:SEA domain-containing protein n=1 Tax=Cirrhinus molitorella TaxID=172907 RepID=A0ABR3MGK0_9TELE
MNIPLKALLIFCLVAAITAQTSANGVSSTPATTDATEASTTDVPSSAPATTDATEASTTNVPSSAPATTDATEASTADVPSSAPATTDATEVTGTSSTDDTPVTSTAATTIITTQGPCAANPCIGESTCEERFGGLFACICRPGLVYLEMRGCIQTKLFPGSLTLNRDFLTDMDNKKSQAFQETASEIEEALRNILSNDDNGYINSTVLRLSQGSIIAEVQNFYELSSDVTLESVTAMIQNGSAGIANFTDFKSLPSCSTGYCDNTTTICAENNGILTCTCEKGYIKSQSTSQACLACPNGKRATDDSEKCEDCPTGFTGFNCNDPYLLVVIVVSTVLGALLIIFIVALIVVSCRNPKGSSSSPVDFSSNYGNKELHKPTGVPRIPRANPDANNLEMTDSGSNQALVTRDRPESKARYNDYEDISYSGQIPPAYSGYSGRGVENGGAHNPYFRQDDDKMRRY